MQKTVLHNQSALDVVLQHTGSLNKLFEMVLLNGLSITDNLEPATTVIVPEVDNDALMNFYLLKNTIPATAIDSLSLISESGGIGSMIIETNFIVQ